MDSLLASYGSDDEDGDASPGLEDRNPVPAPAPAPSSIRSSIFGSLPPPKNSSAPEKSSSLWDDEDDDDEPLKPSSRGNRSSSSSSPAESPPQGMSDGIAETKTSIARPGPGPSPFSALPRPKSNSGAALPSDFFSDSSTSASTANLRVERAIPPMGANSTPGGVTGRLSSSSPSPFASLPPPSSSSKLSFDTLPPPSSASKAKKVVEFRPPINMALLERTDEDENESSRKKSKLSKDAERGATATDSSGGLFAMLPAPKNRLGAGAALGSGNAHGGRRTVMETGSDSYKMAARGGENTTSGVAHQHPRAEFENVEEKAELGFSSHDHGFEPSAYSGGNGSYASPQPDNGYYSSGVGYPEYDAAAGVTGSVYGPGSGQQPFQGSSTSSVLAEVMKKERRKGRDEPPTVMTEVKQADLTGGPKLREDQLRATGIAFGPAYQPTSSTKDKPSKLHRRKHQLGALFFDMKQNEMNLMERRTKGKLTKAETQAKYGW